MAFNVQQIKDRAREITGRGISSQEAQEIMNATGGGDEDQVISFLRGGGVSGGSSSGGGTLEDFIRALVEPRHKEYAAYEQRIKDFGPGGPFAFDEAQAREAQKEIVDPLYDELLSDYVEGIEVERKQGVGNERQLLENLSTEKEFETGEFRRRVEDAIETTREGFETRGLFNSGLRRRAEGRQEAAGNIGEERLGEQFGQRESAIKTDSSNMLERLGIQERVGRHGIERERASEIDIGVKEDERQHTQQTEVERLMVTASPFASNNEDALRNLLQFR